MRYANRLVGSLMIAGGPVCLGLTAREFFTPLVGVLLAIVTVMLGIPVLRDDSAIREVLAQKFDPKDGKP